MARSAPGKHYREGRSLPDLFRKFPDDPAAEAWFEKARSRRAGAPDECPLCGGTKRLRPIPSGRPLPCWCGACRRNFSVRTGTVMHRSHIGLQKWAIAIHLWSISLKGVSSLRLHRDLNITQKSAWYMAQRPLEVDETCIGGKETDRHADRKLRAGRGIVGKAVVAGARDRATEKIAAAAVPGTDTGTLHGFVAGVARPGATVCTGEHAGYRGMPFDHETVWHSVSGYVRGQVRTNGTESFWALLKRGCCGTFHHISPGHLHRYVREFAGRHSLRGRDTETMMLEMFAALVGKRLMYRDPVAGA